MTAASKTMRANLVILGRAQRRKSAKPKAVVSAEPPSTPITTAHQISPRLGSRASWVIMTSNPLSAFAMSIPSVGRPG
jgi:hypothetical protein